MNKLLAALAVSAGVPLFLMACDGPVDTPVASAEVQGIEADLVYYGMVSFLTASGVREGRVEADTAYAFNDSAVVKLRGMRLVFYNADGSERAAVSAEGTAGAWPVGIGRLADSASSELNYDPNADRIWSDSATVQTLANGSVTRGSAFESDLDFRNVRIANPRGAISNIVF